MGNSFIQVILDAALSKESTTKINSQIKKIQNDLKDVTIDFNVNNKGGRAFSEMENQVKSLQNQIKELQAQLNGVGNSNNSRNKPKILGDISDEVINSIRSLDELKNYLKRQGFAVKVDFDVDKKGQQVVKNVIANIKNDVGELQTLKIKPVIDTSGNTSFNLYEESNNDKNAKGFFDNQNKAIQLLEQFSRQGKLTAKDIEDYSKRINRANDNTSLQRTVDQLKELSKITVSDTKQLNATKNLNDQAKRSLVTLEQLKYNASFIGLDTRNIDSLISKLTALSKIEITNDAQITKADRLYSRVSSRVSETRNNLSSLISAQEKYNSILNTSENKGIFNTAELERYRTRLNSIINSSENLTDKLLRLKNQTQVLNNELGEKNKTNRLADGARRAALEAERLQAQLERVVNSYRRTVDVGNANAIRSDLNQLSNVPKFNNDAQIKSYLNDLKAVENRIRSLNSAATTGARANLSLIDNLRVAFERFPTFVIASAAFYAPIRGFQDLTEKVIELDTAITNLRRVSDLPDYKFNEVLEQSIANVDELSAKTSDYLKILNDFARTGLDDQESLALANTATLLQNISELTAEESFNSLTAAQIAFNIEAEESIRIADKLNEVNIIISLLS